MNSCTQPESGCKKYLCAEHRWGLRCLLMWSVVGVAVVVGFEGLALGNYIIEQINDAPGASEQGPGSTSVSDQKASLRRGASPAKAAASQTLVTKHHQSNMPTAQGNGKAKHEPQVLEQVLTNKKEQVANQNSLESGNQKPPASAKEKNSPASVKQKKSPASVKQKKSPASVKQKKSPATAKEDKSPASGKLEIKSPVSVREKEALVSGAGNHKEQDQGLTKVVKVAKMPPVPPRSTTPDGSAHIVLELDDEELKQGENQKQKQTHGMKANMAHPKSKPSQRQKEKHAPVAQVKVLEDQSIIADLESKSKLATLEHIAGDLETKPLQSREEAAKALADFDESTVVPEQEQSYEASGTVHEILHEDLLEEHMHKHKHVFQTSEYARAKNTLQENEGDNFLTQE